MVGNYYCPELTLIYDLHALHSSGCLNGKAKPLSIAAMEISGLDTILHSSSCCNRRNIFNAG